MSAYRSAVTVSLALLASIMLVTNATPAERSLGQVTQGQPPAVWPPIVPHGFFGYPNFPRTTVPHPVDPHPFPPRHSGHHRVIPFGVSAGPVVIYAPSYVPSPGYAPSLGDYYYDGGGYSGAAVNSAAGMTSVATAPTPMPNVVEYPTGRYELRGDGLTVPCTWVWIPNPPSAPPAAPSGGEGFFPTPPPSAGHDKLYRWTDTQGVLHVTDRLEAVPPEYRAAQAKSPEPS